MKKIIILIIAVLILSITSLSSFAVTNQTITGNQTNEIEKEKCKDISGGDGYYWLCKGKTLTHNAGLRLFYEQFINDSEHDELIIVGIKDTGSEFVFDEIGQWRRREVNDYIYEVQLHEYDEENDRIQIYIVHGGLEDDLPDKEEDDDEDIEEDIIGSYNKEQTCNGCKQNDVCLPFGTRLINEEGNKYCDIDLTLKLQKANEQSCQNNYECTTNQCSNNKCVDLAKELKETRSLLQKLLELLSKIFD